ncbi:NAD-dependent epimerase/dehydratase family protein [Bradyrhizobium sp. GCM10023182]|uniref:NAD-dependent epimerase/dehydratase family protein n=1 Tax=Bradyrhizobium zhengyangense TaxID=2911009 RepID=A0ABS9M1R1_9BRAD|nr:NAD-dependent epimerase/dehydratase family protein [Bradyrhizobium zhengyangense]MCG2673205.1 NAD-dependent epimerase/dehydratase family protein [Bradyrhizobium zhengyangense]
MSSNSANGRSAISATVPIRTAIVGTGYIAEFHARAIRETAGVELAASCDANFARNEAFTGAWNIPLAFDSLGKMLQETHIDCVHILTPPDLHFSLAKTALQAGVHVFLEKPMCTSTTEADELIALAAYQDLYLGVSHNFLFSSAFERLRKAVHSKEIGPVDHITFNHFYELGQIRFGPFDNWMLRNPGNVIVETGPHLVSALLDLAGAPEALSVIADREVTLPNGAKVYRRWRTRTTVGRTAIDININFAPGFPQRTISVRGLFGSALLDFDADTCVIDQRTPLDIDFDRFKRSRAIGRQLQKQALAVLARYGFGKLKLVRRGNPYQNSIQDSIAAFYASIRNDKPLDTRIGGRTGRDVIEHCLRMIEASAIDTSSAAAARPERPALATAPTVLVLGGAGFIGKELIRHLLASGYCVRAMVRGSASALDEFRFDRLELVRGDIANRADLERAMVGIEFVYHLAHAQCKTWAEYLARDVEPTRLVGEVCLAANVKRLIYTGTIDSYYAGAKASTITEATPLDPDIHRRNYYARAKATAEDILSDMSRSQQLPLVILRPGIVIGRGGGPFHWGVGRFSENVCEVWGDGRNKLPFVLVSDVAAALVQAIEVPGVEGKSYNLVDSPLLTAREYLQDLQQRGDLKLSIIYQPIWKFYLTDLAKWAVKVVVNHPDRIRKPSYADWESRTQKVYFDCTRTRAELGWKPASDRQRMLDEGIGAALEPWLKAVE